MRAAFAMLGWLLLAGSVALGAPENGFGLAGGVTFNEGRRTPQGERSQQSGSAGLSIAGDAQFTLNERWSFLPYLLLSWEHSSGELSGTSNNGVAGVELRRWYGDLFVGGHIGFYVQLLTTEQRNGTGYGPGAGISVGTERADSLTWCATADLAHVGVFGDHLSVRLHIGKRWD